MRYVTILIAIIVLVILIFAVPRALSESDNIQAGKELAERLCAKCHAIGQTGASPLAKAPPFHVIANRYSVWSLQESLAEGIVTGHHQMPEFKFNPDQIDDLLTFMDTFTKSKSKQK